MTCQVPLCVRLVNAYVLCTFVLITNMYVIVIQLHTIFKIYKHVS